MLGSRLIILNFEVFFMVCCSEPFDLYFVGQYLLKLILIWLIFLKMGIKFGIGNRII